MIFYHITPSTNLESIMTSGLLLNQNQTSLEADILGIYLTSDWKELLLSDTYPEINRHLKIAILEVDCSGFELLDDPEYSQGFFQMDEMDFEVKISKTDINPERIKLIGELHLDKPPRYYSTSLIESSLVLF